MSRRILASVLVTAVAFAACSKDPEVAKREYLKSGDAYVEQRKFREAVVEYRNAIQQDPRFAEARLKLAEAYLETGDAAGALREYVSAADLLPADPSVQTKAGNALLLAGHHEDAKARADKALAVAPANVDALLLHANALAGLRKLDESITSIEEAIRKAPERSETYLNLGTVEMLRGKRPEAEAAFKKAIASNPKSVAAHLGAANFYMASDRRDDAARELNAALAIDPNDFFANRALAVYYIAIGQGAKAEPHLKKFADQAPRSMGKLALADYYLGLKRHDAARSLLDSIPTQDADAYAGAQLRLAGIALTANDAAAAMKRIEDVLKSQPTNPEALVAKADVLAREQKLDAAYEVARKAVESHPQLAITQYALGRIQSARGQYPEAITALNESLKLQPAMATADLELARVYLADGKLKEAEDHLRGALQKAPGYADAHLLNARVQILQKNAAGAESSLKLLSAAMPDSAVVNVELGRLHALQGRRAEARAAFGRALAVEPKSFEALAALVQLDVADGDRAAATSRLDAALEARPQDVRVLTLSGHLMMDRDPEGAERAFRKVIEVDPGYLQAYEALGQLYASQKRLADATREFETLAAKRPSVGTDTIVGMLLEMQGRTKEARARYESIVQRDPRAAVASNNLAWMIAEEGGNLDIALQLAQSAKAHLPDHPDVNDTLGWVYYKKGLGTMAVAPLQLSIEKNPSNPIYHYHLGLVYAKNGDTRRAKASLQRAIALNPSFPGADDARKALQSLTD